MKKFIAIMLVLVIAISGMVSCAPEEAAESTPNVESSKNVETSAPTATTAEPTTPAETPAETNAPESTPAETDEPEETNTPVETPEESTAVAETTDGVTEPAESSVETSAEIPEDTAEIPEDTAEISEDTDEIPEDTDEIPEDTDEIPEDPEETPEETEETMEPETEAPEETPEETEPPIINLEDLLLPTMELDKELAVLAQMLYYDEWLTEDEGDIVGTEIYGRIPRVESRLGIELTVDVYAMDDAVDEIKKRQESTDPNEIVNAATTYCPTTGSLVLEGRYQNLGKSDNIDFYNPWWPEDLIENSVIDGKLYFVSGDISPTLIYETYAIFYNLDLIDKYNIGNPIDMVLGYKWTIDKLIELTSGIYEDLDKGTAGPNIGDFFAFTIPDTGHIKALPFGMGVRVIVPDDDKGYVWSELYTGERMEVVCDKVGDWVMNNPGVTAHNETGYKDYGASFKNGNAIFHLGNFAYASHHIAGTGLEYGVVPCPMFNEEQREYFSYYGNPTSFWGVPTNADIDDSCLLLEYLASDAFVYISPALFERALKLKYVTGEVNGLSKMFDIIRDGLVFDACMPYTYKLSVSYNEFTAITTGVDSWSSQFDGFTKGAMRKTINTIVTTLRGFDN